MNEQQLAEIVLRTDLDLKIRQGAPDIDFEEQVHIEIARGLLKKLRLGIQRGEPKISLGNAWSREATRWILPAISAAHARGFSVSYKLPDNQPIEALDTASNVNRTSPRLSL